jgi:hypothetical protein
VTGRGGSPRRGRSAPRRRPRHGLEARPGAREFRREFLFPPFQFAGEAREFRRGGGENSESRGPGSGGGSDAQRPGPAAGSGAEQPGRGRVPRIGTKKNPFAIKSENMAVEATDGIHLSARPTRRQMDAPQSTRSSIKLTSRSTPTTSMQASSAHNAVARADVETLNQLLKDIDTLQCTTAVSRMSRANEAEARDTSLVTVLALTFLICFVQAGWTLLHTAAQHDHDLIGEILLDRGISVNASGLVGESPLHVCAMFGSTRMAELLLSCNADPAQVTGQTHTAQSRPSRIFLTC